MKKILFVLSLLVASVSAYAGQGGNAGPATDGSNRAEYRWVLNNDAVAHEVGDVVVYKNGSPYGVLVETTTSANIKLVAGIVAINDLPASGYGWIQVHGYHSAITIGAANSAGDCLGTSTTAEATGVTTTIGACIATALEATTSSTTVKGIIRGM